MGLMQEPAMRKPSMPNAKLETGLKLRTKKSTVSTLAHDACLNGYPNRKDSYSDPDVDSRQDLYKPVFEEPFQEP